MPHLSFRTDPLRAATPILVDLLPTVLLALQLLRAIAGRAERLLAAYASESYGLIAGNLVRSGLYSLDGVHPTAIRPPAYPLLLAGAMALGGSGWPVLVLALQAAMAAGCVALTAVLAQRLFRDPGAATLAAALVAANAWLVGEFLGPRETGLYTLLTLLYALTVISAPRTLLLPLALGALTGLAMLTRPSGIVLLPVSLVLLAWIARAAPRRMVLWCGSFVLAAGLLLLPWQAYLHRSFDRLALTGTSTSGMNLFKGNHPVMGEVWGLADVDRADPLIVELLAKEGLDWRRDQWRADDRLGELARASITEDPARFLRRAAQKGVAFLSPLPLPLAEGGRVQLEDGRLVTTAASSIAGSPRSLYLGFVLSLGFLGVVTALLGPRLRLWGLCVAGLVLGTAAVYAVGFPESRFRMPLEPLLAVAAAGLVVELLARSASRPDGRRRTSP
jgi:4-amino-4-deoxy-L-arabinose transferase-like glycosyltransferase